MVDFIENEPLYPQGREEARVKLGQAMSAGVLSIMVSSVSRSVVSDSL